MNFLSDPMIANSMNELPTLFDAHALEKRCLRRNPLEFADEIKRQHATGDAILYFSAVFSKHVDLAFRGQIVKTGKVESENLGGEKSPNQQWRKVVPVITPAPAPAPMPPLPTTPATPPQGRPGDEPDPG